MIGSKWRRAGVLAIGLVACAGEGPGGDDEGEDTGAATETAGSTSAGTSSASTGDASTGSTSSNSTTGSTSSNSTTSSTGSTSSGSTTGEPGDVCGEPEVHMGDGTYYDADGSGNCSFDPSPGDLMVAAINDPEYAGSAPCGACARVIGPEGEVTVRIVDRCPECKTGDLDLSPQAFAMLAPLELGRIDISWTFVPCAVSGPLRYRFKEGSSQWWTAVQVRNHRHAIASFEYSKDGGQSFVPVVREDYNYFVAPEGMGPDPLVFRVTDVAGHVVLDSGLVVGDAIEVDGAEQLPVCR
ncbi:MAG: expansin EXLX1 family cellulose-binding protein [Nannocystaceae bacterium]